MDKDETRSNSGNTDEISRQQESITPAPQRRERREIRLAFNCPTCEDRGCINCCL